MSQQVHEVKKRFDENVAQKAINFSVLVFKNFYIIF